MAPQSEEKTERDAGAGHVGALLQASRQRLGEELPDVALMLRIRLPYMAAIEAGRYRDLPGATYAVGFIRAYAEHLGLDSEEVVRRFKAETIDGGADQKLSFPTPVPETGIPGGAYVFIGLVIAVLAYGTWYVSTTEDGFFAELISPLDERFTGLLSGNGDAGKSPETKDQDASTPPAIPAGEMPAAEPDPQVPAPEADASQAEPTTETPTSPAPLSSATGQQSALVETPELDPAVADVEPNVPEAAGAAESSAPVTAMPEAPAAAATEKPVVAAAVTAAPTVTPKPVAVPAPAPKPAVSPAAPAPVAAAVDRASTPVTTPVERAVPVPPAPQAEPAAVAEAVAPTPPVAVTTAPPAPVEEFTAPVIAAAEPTAAAEPDVATPAPPPVPAQAEAETEEDVAAVEEAAVSGTRIVINAKNNSWIQVRDDVANQMLVTRLLTAGDSYEVPDRPGLVLLTGNAGALEITVDGSAVPSIGGSGVVRRGVVLEADRLKAGTAVTN